MIWPFSKRTKPVVTLTLDRDGRAYSISIPACVTLETVRLNPPDDDTSGYKTTPNRKHKPARRLHA